MPSILSMENNQSPTEIDLQMKQFFYSNEQIYSSVFSQDCFVASFVINMNENYYIVNSKLTQAFLKAVIVYLKLLELYACSK